MMWRNASIETPPAGHLLLTYGFIAPDGPSRVVVDTAKYTTSGALQWGWNDVVTHWAYLHEVPTPEGES